MARMRRASRRKKGETRSGRSRRPYHHGDLARALIDAASVIVDRYGSASLTLREAARRAGVSHNAPYRHFADRSALAAAVAADGFLMLAEDIESASRLRAGASAVARAYASFVEDYPGRFALMFGPDLRGAANAHLNGARDALRDALRRAFGKKDADAYWSAMHGYAALVQAGLLDSGDFEALDRLFQAE